jgi:hypothetical protein
MRIETQTRQLFTFNELSEDAQDKAVERLWDINVDYDWDEHIINSIEEFGADSGLGGKYGGSFDLDRGSFLHIIGLNCLFSEIYEPWRSGRLQDEWKTAVAATIDPFFKAFSPREICWVLRLEKVGSLDVLSGETSTKGRSARCDLGWLGADCRRVLARALVEKLALAWEDLVSNLEHYFLKQLRDEYAYQTSRAQIIDSILANCYEFTEDGTLV